MRTTLVAGLLLLAILCSSAPAQPYGTDILASSTSQMLLRISPTGVVNTVATGVGGTCNMVCMDNDNVHIVICRASPPALFRVDPAMNQIVSTIWAGAPLPYIDYFNPTSTGDFLVAANTDVYVVKGDGSSVKTVYSGAPLQNLQGCIQDLATGFYAMGDITADAVFMIAPDGTLVTTHAFSGMNPFSLTQDHRDGALIVGNGGGGVVHRLFPGAASLTTVSTSAGNANAICFDRWSGSGEIVVGTTTISRMDILGTVIQTHPGIPGTNSGMCFDRGRNLVTMQVGAANQYQILLNFPGDGGKPYVLGLSISGFSPGIPLAGRVVQLVPDEVFRLSMSGNMAPFFKNNIGNLNTADRALATLDLRTFGKLLSGLRVWFAAVVVDLNAPGNIGAISKPCVIVLD